MSLPGRIATEFCLRGRLEAYVSESMGLKAFETTTHLIELDPGTVKNEDVFILPVQRAVIFGNNISDPSDIPKHFGIPGTGRHLVDLV